MSEHLNVDVILNGLIDELAAVEHERWSRWQRYMHSKGIKQADGTLLLPAELVQRWDRQAATDYGYLSDQEKESDREQVNRYLQVIASALKSRSHF